MKTCLAIALAIIYAAAVILFAALTGSVSFQGALGRFQRWAHLGPHADLRRGVGPDYPDIRALFVLVAPVLVAVFGPMGLVFKAFRYAGGHALAGFDRLLSRLTRKETVQP